MYLPCKSPLGNTCQREAAILDDAEARLLDLGNKAQRADWVHANFITNDTDQIAADALDDEVLANTPRRPTAADIRSILLATQQEG